MREWIPGRHPVYELLKAGRRQVFELMLAEGVQEKDRLAEILNLCRTQKIPVGRFPRQKLDDITQPNQGVLLRVGEYPYLDLGAILERARQRDEPPFILILDALQDPQNLGTLLRTAEIVGVHGVLLPFRRTATITPAVVNASSGASEHLIIAQLNLHQAIDTLKAAGVWVIGLEGGPRARSLEQVRLDGPLALVVGSEGQGMRQLVERSCDLLLRLPMRGEIDSLNAAVAGSVALYLAWQARAFQGRRSAPG
ncbi:MAG: 23S rRNA (guanosine(2251)-2'-O)-methyltransferase RlmB [Anaerolineales bacterium]|jgi:23S rRNA (guanosine2251-2'-O)-methyltransferase